jgi:hypothetical protein
MSTLDRYKKSGGFVQLLALLETSAPAKREKFFELIRAEDGRWANALREKIIDMDRIYSWSDDTLVEIIGTLQDLTLAVAANAADEATRNRLLGLLSHGRRRKIDDLMQTQRASPGEIATMHAKIIETVRKMSIDGFLRFEKFDPVLAVEEDIEEKMAKATTLEGASPVNLHVVTMNETETGEVSRTDIPASHTEVSESRIMEIQALKKRIAELSKENAMLRHELSIVRSKLDQIKKIA